MTTTCYDLGTTTYGYRMMLVTQAGANAGTGAVTVTVDAMSNITCALNSVSNGRYLDDFVVTVGTTTIAGNVITLNIEKMQASATNTWGAVADADPATNLEYSILCFGR